MNDRPKEWEIGIGNDFEVGPPEHHEPESEGTEREKHADDARPPAGTRSREPTVPSRSESALPSRARMSV